MGFQELGGGGGTVDSVPVVVLTEGGEEENGSGSERRVRGHEWQKQCSPRELVAVTDSVSGASGALGGARCSALAAVAAGAGHCTLMRTVGSQSRAPKWGAGVSI